MSFYHLLQALFLLLYRISVLQGVCFQPPDCFFPVLDLRVVRIPAVVVLSVDDVEELALLDVLKQHDVLLDVEHLLKAILDAPTEGLIVRVAIDLDQHVHDLLNPQLMA